MGSGGWFKAILSLKKSKDNRSTLEKVDKDRAKLNGLKTGSRHSHKAKSKIRNGAIQKYYLGRSDEEVAAIRIQTAFRSYVARKNLRHSKGAVRLRGLIKGHTAARQASNTLGHLKLWIKIQEQIRARRIHMATEGRVRQKKIENQSKLETKLHEVQVEWNGSSDSMEEVFSRIHLREEASVKRERTLAYAFNHQWRASQNQLFAYDLSKASEWEWSWKERWIAARPWEARVLSHSSSPSTPVSKQPKKASKKLNSPIAKAKVKQKSSSSEQEPQILKRPTSRKLVLEDAKTKEKSSSPPKPVKPFPEKSLQA